MSDASLNVSEHSGTKPRLSLLSSKQGIRLNSEDQPDQVGISARDEWAKNFIQNPTVKEHNVREDLESHATNSEEESRRLNGNSRNEENKMNITKEDLIRLLSMLKSELQSKEIALAAIKCEQLKRLINPVEISRSSLANTYIELQDRFKTQDQNNNTKRSLEQSSSASTENQRNGSTEIPNTRFKDQDIDENRESLNILNTLLELLDRHPLLALPRDSIYCLDYNCNELSTKNYLNLKIQHLDNLINQHRRYRYYMNEHVKRAEQRFHELAGDLEIERSLKYDNEKAAFKTSGRTILLKHIDQLKSSLEKEKRDKQTIVMTLLNELLDERERSESLAKKLADQESISADSKKNTTGKEERFMLQEIEVNNLSTQLKKQSMVFHKEKNEFQSKIHLLETENTCLKTKLEQQEKQITALLKSPSISESKEQSQMGPSSGPNKANIGVKQANLPSRQTSNPATPAVVSRSSLGAKSSPPPKTAPISNHQATASSRVSAHGVSSNSGTQTTSTTSKTNTGTPGSQRPSAPPVVSRISNNPNAEQTSIRIQPLFKSASVQSTNQQVRNLKNVANNGGHTAPLTRASSSSSNPPVTKPQVPAKPAQLLDQQRNSLS